MILGRANLEDNVGLGPEFRRRKHGCPDFLVEGIGKLGRLARAGLDRHIKAKLDELGHVLRRSSDSALPGRDFLWNSY